MEHRGSPSGYVLVIGGRLTALEELDLPYTFHHVQVWKGEQFTPECKAINPNSKVPGIVDSAGPDGAPFALFESGAILTYLAEKCGVFLPASGRERYEVLAWLTFQVAGLEIREISEASRLQATPNDIDRIFGRGTFTRANE
jgi:glutathione S-transferase